MERKKIINKICVTMLLTGAMAGISCSSNVQVKNQDPLSFESFMQQEKKNIKKEFYFFFQDMIAPEIVHFPSQEEGGVYEESLYDQIAYPYQSTVIVAVKIDTKGVVRHARIIKNGTDAQNEYCLRIAKKLKFRAAYLGGTKYPAEVQVVFSKLEQ